LKESYWVWSAELVCFLAVYHLWSINVFATSEDVIAARVTSTTCLRYSFSDSVWHEHDPAHWGVTLELLHPHKYPTSAAVLGRLWDRLPLWQKSEYVKNI